MSGLGIEYQEHLANLYPNNVIALHENAINALPEERHHIFEIVRRFLDVCRILNKNWPTALRFVTSCQGDEVLEAIFPRVLQHIDTKELKDAIHQSALEALSALPNPVYFDLFCYESCIARPGKTLCLYESNKTLIGYKLVLTSKYDIPNLFTSLNFYRKTHAPASFYRTLQIPMRITHLLKEL